MYIYIHTHITKMLGIFPSFEMDIFSENKLRKFTLSPEGTLQLI